MNKPKYVKIGDKKYPINTDFRIALECNNIAMDESIGDYERSLAIIYKLFGEEGLECDDQVKLLELGMKYLTFGKVNEKQSNKLNYELDINKCKGIIISSFKYDYGYDPYELEYLHWYDFYNDLENLSTSEFGNCCIFNRITGVLNTNPSEIKDSKYRKQVIEAQKELKEKYCKEKKSKITDKQRESAKEFYKSLGINL